MSAVIAELLQVLVSKNGQEKMTKEEGEFFFNWRANTIKSSIIGGSIASGLVYIATRKLNTINHFSLAGGAGIVAGYWRVQKSLETCVDQILGLDGSRMQCELKKIVLLRYGDDPRRMQKFSKHFYGEEVFSDINPEYPRLIYRQRSVFMDDPKVAHQNVYGVSDDDGQQQNDYQRSKVATSLTPKGPNMEIKQVRINPGISVYGYGDPLDVLFGNGLANEDVQQPHASDDAVKVQGRNRKKSRRRQRMRHRYRESLSLGEPTLLTA